MMMMMMIMQKYNHKSLNVSAQLHPSPLFLLLRVSSGPNSSLRTDPVTANPPQLLRESPRRRMKRVKRRRTGVVRLLPPAAAAAAAVGPSAAPPCAALTGREGGAGCCMPGGSCRYHGNPLHPDGGQKVSSSRLRSHAMTAMKFWLSL